MINSSLLKNGIRVITQRSEYMQTVCIGIWVTNGSRHEPIELNGVAHFIEHLLFKGTERRSARQISLEIDSIGGILNAFTGHEYVCYYAKVLAKFLPNVTDLLTDIFIHSTFPPDEIERERNVILQEIKMRDDTPDEFIHDHFHQNFWSGHPLGLSILGSEATINSLSREDIIRYKESRYRPGEIIIAAAGNVHHLELVALLEPAFSLALPVISPPSDISEFLSTGINVNLTERDMEQTLICMGTPALPQNHPDRFAMFLLSTILGGGMSSRLFQEVREKRGLAYAVYSYIISHADTGSLVVSAGTEQKHCQELLNIALDEMRRIKQEPVQQNELDSAREQIKGKLQMSLESSDSLMTRLAKNEIYLGRNQTIEELLAAYDAVSAEDIQKVGCELFSGERLHLEVMGRTGGMEVDLDRLKL